MPLKATGGIGCAALLLSMVFLCGSLAAAEVAQPHRQGDLTPVDIGDRLELFVDDYLLDSLSGGAERRLHHPEPREVVMKFGAHGEPWEARRGGAYPALVQDGDRILIYYSAAPHRPSGRRQRTCVIESQDGVNFTRPVVGLHEVDGSTENNVVWPGNLAGHHFAPFLDARPGVPEDARFKAFARGPGGMRFYASPDGYDWRLMEHEPEFTPGPSDTQNVAFWDPVREHYVAYLRAFRIGSGPRAPGVDFYGRDEDGVRVGSTHRCVRRATSPDLRNWTETKLIEYDDDRIEHMYTNGIQPYYRAPHIYIGLPNRFVTGRAKVAGQSSGINDALLMSSRDGERFQRWPEAFIRADTDRENWGNRSHYPAWGMAQTSPTEISLYWNEHTRFDTNRLRRGTIRVDGFVSVRAGGEGGELLTRPLVFSGDRLVVNYRTSANGEMLFELADESGDSIPGFGFNESEQLFGNAIEHMVSWTGGADLSDLAGRPVRLRVRLRDADLYSIRFEPSEDIRARLSELAEQARERLEDPLPAFAGRCLGELAESREALERWLRRDTELGRQETLGSAALVQRALHRHRACQRTEKRARTAIERAGAEPENGAGFGSMYREAARLLRGGLEFALADAESCADSVRALANRLEGALSDIEKATVVAARAAEELATAEAAADEQASGFGALYQARISSLAEDLRGLLDDPRATISSAQRASEQLAESVAAHREVGEFAPVRSREAEGAAVSVSLGGRSEWERGQLANLAPEEDTLALPFQPEMVFPVRREALARFPADEQMKSPVVTVEAWVRLDNTLGFLAPVLRLGGPRDTDDLFRGAWSLRAHQRAFLFSLGSEEGEALVTARTARDALAAGEWYHVAATCDGREVRLYLNGELAASEEMEGALDHTHTESLVFGGHPGRRNADRFEGSLRDVRVWSTVRTEAQIRENMDRELTGQEESLEGHWLAGPRAGDGEKVFDLSGRGNHGTMSRAAWRRNSGYRISNPIRFPDISEVAHSRIEWRAETEGAKGDAGIEILVGLSSGGVLPSEWHRAASGAPLPGVEPGQDMRGQRLWVKQRISSAHPGATARLKQIRIELRQ